MVGSGSGEFAVLVHPAQGLGAVLHRLPVVDRRSSRTAWRPGILVFPSADVAVEGARFHPLRFQESGAWALVAVTMTSASLTGPLSAGWFRLR